jgi:hypothetical protein
MMMRAALMLRGTGFCCLQQTYSHTLLTGSLAAVPLQYQCAHADCYTGLLTNCAVWQGPQPARIFTGNPAHCACGTQGLTKGQLSAVAGHVATPIAPSKSLCCLCLLQVRGQQT